MRTLGQWLQAYGESHQHPLNRSIHHVCVPCIMLGLFGLLWLLPLPFGERLPAYLNHVSVALVCLAVVYYFILSWRIAVGVLVMCVLMLLGIGATEHYGGPLLELSVAVFVVAWIGQFIGHAIEGKRPSFSEDLRFLLIGPLWVIAYFYEVLGVTIDDRIKR